MVKDRFSELKQSVDNDGAIILSNGDTNSLRDMLSLSTAIGQWIGQIEKNNNETRILIRKVEDVKHQDTGDKLQDLFQNNTSLARKISEKLKLIQSSNNEQNAENRIRNIQQNTLKTRFEKAFIENNKLLEAYKSAQKKVIKSQLVAKGYFGVTDEEVALLLEEGGDLQVFTDNILAETAEAKRVLANVEERHQQLLEIERMLTEVRDLFVQISILVDSQQELLDRIEYQAQITVDTVGAVDLETVRKSKNRYMKKKFILIGVILIVVLILLIILLK